MRNSKMILLLVGMGGLLLGLPTEARACCPAPGPPPPCLVANPGSGALPIRGTISAEVQDVGLAAGGGSPQVDFTARLTRSGVTHFFRVSIFFSIGTLAYEEIACFFLAAKGADILTAFGLDPATRKLVITDKSISDAESPTADQTIFKTDGTSTNRGSSLADIVIFAQ